MCLSAGSKASISMAFQTGQLISRNGILELSSINNMSLGLDGELPRGCPSDNWPETLDELTDKNNNNNNIAASCQA